MSKPMMNTFQPSFTEWFAAVGDNESAQALRLEDNIRNERFEGLYQAIGFPYDRPEFFTVDDLLLPSPSFRRILDEWTDPQLAAIRLVPVKPELPKLRVRALPIKECYDWFKKQTINAGDYSVEVYKHFNNKVWSTHFVIKEKGIYGEVVQGSPSQLSHGEKVFPAHQFLYNFKNWQWSEFIPEAQEALEQMLTFLVVKPETQQKLAKAYNCVFFQNYLGGYYECYVTDTGKVVFIDYNRLLADYVDIPQNIASNLELNAALQGAVAFPGQVTGRVRIVDIENFDQNSFEEGDILVCDNTDVRFVPLMKKAGAIVTNRGGILSHAAIVARELKKPCIIGTGKATQVLHDGEQINVYADRGVIIKIF